MLRRLEIRSIADGSGRLVVIGLLLLMILFLPFINKAIHIDDWVFLEIGNRLGWNPLDFYPADTFYQGRLVNDASPYALTHPLLIPYLLKIVQKVAGQRELVLHLFFLFFPALALWGLMKLHGILIPSGKNGALLLALFCSVPAFVVNGQNLMTDVPTLAFLLAGIGLFLQGVVHGKSGCLWFGSFWLTCAAFSSYQALFFLPLLMLFVCSFRRGDLRGIFKGLTPLLMPILLMAGWLGLIYGLHGILPGVENSDIEGEVTRGLQEQIVVEKFYYALSLTGASLLFVLPLRIFSLSIRAGIWVGLLFSALLVAFFVTAPVAAGEGAPRFLFALFCSLGAISLGMASFELKRWWTCTGARACVLLCGGWILVALGYNLILLPFGSARYLLPILPVLFLILLKNVATDGSAMTRLAVVCTLSSVLWGAANAWSDYSYAESYRRMAVEAADFRQTLSPHQQVWFIGEWGMRYYFTKAGMRYLLANSLEPRSGDYLVTPEMPRFWNPSPRLQPRLDFYASREFRSGLPVRLFSRRAGAGFYAHHWGMLPFSFSNEPDEYFVIQRVR